MALRTKRIGGNTLHGNGPIPVMIRPQQTRVGFHTSRSCGTWLYVERPLLALPAHCTACDQADFGDIGFVDISGVDLTDICVYCANVGHYYTSAGNRESCKHCQSATF